MRNDTSFETVPQGEEQRRVRRREINRQQLLLRPVEVEKLVDLDHPVRAIWELVGRLGLEPFYAEVESIEGVAGRPVWDPRLLISLWVYAYKDGVSSAREIARLCEYHPAYQWLTGLEIVNYHTLADFRIRHKEALDQLFIKVLGVLSHEGLITLQRVMHDGTKVKACASDKSFHRKATLEDHLRLAREQVEQMGDPESEELSERATKARQRALREKQQRHGRVHPGYPPGRSVFDHDPPHVSDQTVPRPCCPQIRVQRKDIFSERGLGHIGTFPLCDRGDLCGCFHPDRSRGPRRL
jgi:transposase